MSRSTSTTTPHQQAADLGLTINPQRLPAQVIATLADGKGGLRLPLLVGRTKGSVSRPGEVTVHPQSVRIDGVRPSLTTLVWVALADPKDAVKVDQLRGDLPADDAQPKAATKGSRKKATPAATAQADQDQAQAAQLQAELDKLNAKNGLNSRDSKRREELHQLIEASKGRRTSRSKKAPAPRAGMDDATRQLAKVANDLANPAAKVTGPNVAHLQSVLATTDIMAADKTIVGMKVATLAKYARSGNKDDLGKAGLSDRFREVSRAAGPNTFYGKKLAAMLVAIARA